jgi:LmbE family N-acetylglucosaminyl deacetylase
MDNMGHGGRGVRYFLRQRLYPAFCEGLAALGRPLLLARAADVTSQTQARSCLVLAPHPDDETLGCGATIMRKLAAGARVSVVIATDGRLSPRPGGLSADRWVALREEETRRACAILGLSDADLVFLRIEDQRLADHQQLLRERLAATLDDLKPDEMFVSSMIDSHPDHRALAEVARELAQTRAQRLQGFYEYPVWFWDPRLWRIRDLFDLQVRIVRMDEFRLRKREAIAAYRSQITNLTGGRGGAPLRGRFLRQFTGYEEIFFEIQPAAHLSSAAI